ncbi:L-rhamnose mutarotase [Desulfosediminicola flagellatus]|uniref:L-rhamnose mutarotase n=1 Tax=Desulfosediminicola flagellatus TaxID=2569541 RepID=UPI0010AD8D50|nr:L-rhamnose mutarotase [Desulfosediminicola flagellatus]
MEKIAFAMQLNPGQKHEYKLRHETIWPELTGLLKDAGISDYTIYLDEETNILFAVLKRTSNHAMDSLPDNEIMRRWWEYMAPIMKTNEDNSPVSRSLTQVFHMD